MSRDAAGERAVLVDMTHAAQVAFTFFADVAENDERDGQFNSGVEKRADDGQHSDDSGGIVAGAGSVKTVAVEHWMEWSGGGKNGVDVRGEKNDRDRRCRPGGLSRVRCRGHCRRRQSRRC